MIEQGSTGNSSLFKISVSTLPYLEPVLAKELEHLGATEIEIAKRIVHCVGNLELVYKANLQLRTALRVFVPIQSFSIRHSDELYKRALSIDWSQYLTQEKTFAIEPNVHSVMFNHTNFASLRLKDAIADFFIQKEGKRPNVNPDNPDVLFNLHIDEHRVTISLDSSGESLNRRGYRVEGAKAPLNEVLAAGMVLLTGWQGTTNFYNPMCGSGTLAIEAAMLATNTPALWLRKSFGFSNWKSFNARLWQQIRDEAEQNITKANCKIFASDTDKRQLQAASENIKAAQLPVEIKLSEEDFFETKPLTDQGIVVLNPPYGERMPQDEIDFFYKRIGSHLKHEWQGHSAWIISANQEALKFVGLKPSKKLNLMNSTLQCKFNEYELFKGKRAEFKTTYQSKKVGNN